MDDYTAIFEGTRSFLKQRGARVRFEKGHCASQSEIESFERAVGVVLPAEFSKFCRHFANGLLFAWEKSDLYVEISIPPLEQLGEQAQVFLAKVRDFAGDPNSMDGCDDLQDRQAAFEIWNQMKLWIPLAVGGEGDAFCLDTRTGRVVYDQHDWYDGFGLIAKTNGLPAGEDFYAFLRNWSAVSFQEPLSLWWGEFGEFGSITWARDRFNAEFCQALS
jgi:hypothetical protein